METFTSAGAGAALTTPLWMQHINPYAQFVVCVLGGVWFAVQIYYKIKHHGKN
jgi:hypothetical protein